jgi:hypothetical protein
MLAGSLIPLAALLSAAVAYPAGRTLNEQLGARSSLEARAGFTSIVSGDGIPSHYKLASDSLLGECGPRFSRVIDDDAD